MRFCGHCGAQAATTWACPACGGENPAGMRFCGHCGAPATATPDAAPAVPAAAATPAAPSPAEQDVGEALRSFVVGAVADRLIEAGGKLPEERRLITALFADVSGFTSLADRLDPDQLVSMRIHGVSPAFVRDLKELMERLVLRGRLAQRERSERKGLRAIPGRKE